MAALGEATSILDRHISVGKRTCTHQDEIVKKEFPPMSVWWTVFDRRPQKGPRSRCRPSPWVQAKKGCTFPAPWYGMPKGCCCGADNCHFLHSYRNNPGDRNKLTRTTLLGTFVSDDLELPWASRWTTNHKMTADRPQSMGTSLFSRLVRSRYQGHSYLWPG